VADSIVVEQADHVLNKKYRNEEEPMTTPTLDFTGLRATYINCTLKRSPEVSNTQGLIDASAAIMRRHGIEVEVIRAIDHPIATGVYPDMRDRGWDVDAWPEIYPRILASEILVIAGPIWLGDNSSQTKKIIERLYALSGMLNDKGQYLFYGRVGGCLITGNEDGIKHCAQNILYSLQHIGYLIPPNPDLRHRVGSNQGVPHRAVRREPNHGAARRRRVCGRSHRTTCAARQSGTCSTPALFWRSSFSALCWDSFRSTALSARSMP
jgi:multimeric flavodoxin WrbA